MSSYLDLLRQLRFASILKLHLVLKILELVQVRQFSRLSLDKGKDT